MTGMADLLITTQDDLVGSGGDKHYKLPINRTNYGNARFLSTDEPSSSPVSVVSLCTERNYAEIA